MKRAYLQAIILSALLFFSCVPVAGAQGPVIEVGAYIYPPASYLDEGGVLTGITVTALDATLRDMGYVPKFSTMPFRRCLESMKEGLFPIMLPCVINENRLKYMQYSAPVYFIDSVLWKRTDDDRPCWDDYDDLKRLRIGATLGYAYGPEWDAAVNAQIFTVDYVAGKAPEKAHFAKLEIRRTDMFICEKQLGQFIKEKYSPKFDNIVPCPKSVGPVRSFNAPISRKYFRDHNLDPDLFLKRFNEALARYRQL